MLRTYHQTVENGTIWPIGVPGNFFRILDAGAPITVSLLKGTREVGKAEEIGAGFWSREPFDAIEIRSSVTQFVKVVISDGEAGYDIQQQITTTTTAGGTASADYLAAIRATVALMYPTMTSDELDVFMLFVTAGYTSNQQAIFAASESTNSTAAELRGILANFS